MPKKNPITTKPPSNDKTRKSALDRSSDHTENPNVEIIKKRTGRLLSTARANRGISSKALGETLGISQPRVSQVEKGENLEIATLARLADAMNYDLEIRLNPKEMPILSSMATKPGARGTFTSPLLATASDISIWANSNAAKVLLPVLIYRLIISTIAPNQIERIHLPANEGVQLGGFDGVVTVLQGNQYVLSGTSVWELSTSSKQTAKADKDYEKRTQNPLGFAPKSTTYVAVSARRWSGKNDWERSKIAERHWQAVRTYDADDLESWLSLAPVTHVWFSKLIGTCPPDVSDLMGYWDEWSRATQPAVTPQLLMSGRKQEIQRIMTWLQGGPSVLTIQGETRAEAVAFFAAVLQILPMADALFSRSLVVKNLEVWRQLTNLSDQLLLIPMFDERDTVSIAAQTGHYVCMPLGREDGAVAGTVKLPPIDPTEAQDALKKMEFGIFDQREREEKIREMSAQAYRSLEALRRSWSVGLGVNTPDWAKTPEPSALLAAMLVETWRDDTTGDQEVMSLLAGERPYREVVRNLEFWRSKDAPPIRKLVNEWVLVSREDSWKWLSKRLTQHDLETFSGIAIKVLGVTDPALELSAEQRHMANILGKQMPYSDLLRKGISETLAFMAAISDELALDGTRSGQDWANHIVRRLLHGTGWMHWASLDHLLPLLAEAAPRVFLESVSNALDGNESLLSKLFSDQNDSLFGSSSRHTGLLWALEGLAWNPDYLDDVAHCLARLVQIDPGGKLSNRPSKSLADIFRFWHPQTRATYSQRLLVLERLVRTYPDQAWSLMTALLPQSYGMAMSTHAPKWRQWGAHYTPQITYSELFNAATWTVEQSLKLLKSKKGHWSALIEALNQFADQQATLVIEALEALKPSGQAVEDNLEISHALREVIVRHTDFPDATWAMPKPLIRRLHTLLKRFEPSTGVEQYFWLFERTPKLPGVHRHDLQLWHQQLQVERLKAIRSLYKSMKLEGVLELARRVERRGDVGYTLGQLKLTLHEENRILQELAGVDDVLHDLARHFVFSTAFHRGSDWLEAVLLRPQTQLLSTKHQARLHLCLPFTPETWQRLEHKDIEVSKHYWAEVNVYGHGELDRPAAEQAVQHFLDHGRPKAAIDFISLYHKHFTAFQKELPVELTVAALNQFLQNPSAEKEDQDAQYSIPELLSGLAESGLEPGRLALFDLQFFSLLQHDQRGPKALYDALGKDPGLFHELLTWLYISEHDEPDSKKDKNPDAARTAYDVFYHWRVLPSMAEDGSIDTIALRAWVTGVRELAQASGRKKVGDQCIGKVLSQCPTGTDGIWPHEVIRDLLEDLRSEHVETGLEIGRFNTRGMVSRGLHSGGELERQLVEQYQKGMEIIGDRWPRTKRVLDALAKTYSRSAMDEDNQADLEKSIRW
jgi:transcriptional regulator with XRE-family HTH domain